MLLYVKREPREKGKPGREMYGESNERKRKRKKENEKEKKKEKR